LLIEDEIARREQRKLVMRQRRAGITFNLGVNQAQIMDLATCRYLEEKVPVLIVGPCGTGKSHLAQALGHIAVRRGYDTVFASHAKLLGQLASARAVGNFERKLAALTKADLLIIDDFGLKPMRPGQDEDFHDVIADHYERRPTIITSNLDFSEWNDAFHNKMLDAATLALNRICAAPVSSYWTIKPIRSLTEIFSLAKGTHEHVSRRSRQKLNL
jgi:DNA replication protein DnaC